MSACCVGVISSRPVFGHNRNVWSWNRTLSNSFGLWSGLSAALRGVLGVLQHPGPQFWGPQLV